MFYISSPFGLSCPAHLSISSTELITFQLFCSFQPLTIGTDAWFDYCLKYSKKASFMFLEFVLLHIYFIHWWVVLDLKKKKKEIVIELVHHIRPPVRTQDRDKYKKKKHPDIWNRKNHSVIELLVQNEIIIWTYWCKIVYVTAHTVRDILRGQK